MSDIKSKSILVLGGTRFLGPALIRSLKTNDKYKEYSVSCFNRGLHYVDLPNVTQIIGNRHSATDMFQLFSDNYYDIVIDLSGTDIASIQNAVVNARKSCGRYVFISSSSVYSPSICNPHNETEVPVNGTGESYAHAKIKGEALVKATFPHYTVIRPSKIYGPGNYYFSESDFLSVLNVSNEVHINKDPLLHFSYIDDVISGIVALIETDGIFNVAGAEPAKLSDFIRIIGELHGIEPSFVHDGNSSLPFTDLDDRTLDLSLAKQTVGWVPEIKLRDGLIKTFAGIDYMLIS